VVTEDDGFRLIDTTTGGAADKLMAGSLDARIHAGEQVVEGKPRGSWPKVAASAKEITRLAPTLLVVGSARPTGRTSVVRSEMIVACQPRTSSSLTATTRHSRRIE